MSRTSAAGESRRAELKTLRLLNRFNAEASDHHFKRAIPDGDEPDSLPDMLIARPEDADAVWSEANAHALQIGCYQKQVRQLERQVKHLERELSESIDTLKAREEEHEEELKDAMAVDQNNATIAGLQSENNKLRLIVDEAREERIGSYTAMKRAEEKQAALRSQIKQEVYM